VGSVRGVTILERLLVLAFVALSAGCGGASMQEWKPPTARDTGDDPAGLRPGYCAAGLPVWWSLTAPEADALRALAAARAGDPPALMALAILASGDRRDAGSYRAFQESVQRFVAQVRPSVDQARDDWHRGYELHRAMHRGFFRSQGSGLENYDFNQSRVTRIFDSSRYNCISSAMLFAVLARNFGMRVQGVSTLTHALAQLALADGKILEIETTTDTGFDHIHDERFYREAAAQWSSSRGLPPVTFEQYQRRRILEPYQLMALGMINQAAVESGETQARLVELSAVVDPASYEAQRGRLQMYANEAKELKQRGAARTTVKLFDCVRPTLSEAASMWAADPVAMRFMAWANFYYADALAIVGRGEEAVTTARTALGRLDPRWEDASALRENFVSIVMDRMNELMEKRRFAEAVSSLDGQFDACRASEICTHNLEAVFLNWSAQEQNAGNWPAARDALRGCVAQLPSSANCRASLNDLESRHRF